MWIAKGLKSVSANLARMPVPLAVHYRGSHIMSDDSPKDANKSLEPPLIHPAVPPGAERAEQSPLPEAPYRPYADKPAKSEPRYEPYKGM
jgi:hypothetical protein